MFMAHSNTVALPRAAEWKITVNQSNGTFALYRDNTWVTAMTRGEAMDLREKLDLAVCNFETAMAPDSLTESERQIANIERKLKCGAL